MDFEKSGSPITGNSALGRKHVPMANDRVAALAGESNQNAIRIKGIEPMRANGTVKYIAKKLRFFVVQTKKLQLFDDLGCFFQIGKLSQFGFNQRPVESRFASQKDASDIFPITRSVCERF